MPANPDNGRTQVTHRLGVYLGKIKLTDRKVRM